MKLKHMYNFVIWGLVLVFIVILIFLASFVSMMGHSRVLYQDRSDLVKSGYELLNNNNELIKLMRMFSATLDIRYLNQYEVILNDSNSLDAKINRMEEIGLTDEEMHQVDRIWMYLDELAAIEDRAIEAFNDRDHEGMAHIINSEEYTITDTLLAAQTLQLIDEMYKRATQDISNHQSAIERRMALVGLILFGSMAFFWFVQLLQRKYVLVPIVRLEGIADRFSEGDINIQSMPKRNDEIGNLCRHFEDMVEAFKTIIIDMEDIAIKQRKDGQMDALLEVEKYKGAYANLATVTNEMIEHKNHVINESLECISNIVDGDFDASIRQFPGQEAFVNESVEKLRSSIKMIAQAVEKIAYNAGNGHLGYKLDHTRYRGEWVKLILGMNGILSGVHDALNESCKVIYAMENGDFTKKVEGEFMGEFQDIKSALNTTVESVSSYIEEINQVLADVAAGDLQKNIERRYIGQFSTIKDSINVIVKQLNNTIHNIAATSDFVLNGAEMVSNSSTGLSHGTSEQASALEELTAVMNEIDKHSRENTGFAQNALEIAGKSKDNVEVGNEEMSQLLKAMEGISEASQQIGDIIKTIDDIAFQTNLLALNASVEAARAGEHGKGFAVVAGSVRNLATKSSDAAQETSEMVRESIDRVEAGTRRVNDTASSLARIVDNIMDMSDVITKIHDSSVKQRDAINHIGDGLENINGVVLTNASTSEESAAAAEELTAQAESLRQMIAYFKTNE